MSLSLNVTICEVQLHQRIKSDSCQAFCVAAAGLLCDPSVNGSVLVGPEDPFPCGALCGCVYLPSGGWGHGWG